MTPFRWRIKLQTGFAVPGAAKVYIEVMQRVVAAALMKQSMAVRSMVVDNIDHPPDGLRPPVDSGRMRDSVADSKSNVVGNLGTDGYMRVSILAEPAAYGDVYYAPFKEHGAGPWTRHPPPVDILTFQVPRRDGTTRERRIWVSVLFDWISHHMTLPSDDVGKYAEASSIAYLMGRKWKAEGQPAYEFFKRVDRKKVLAALKADIVAGEKQARALVARLKLAPGRM